MMEYSEDDYLMLSGIQHYAFCRRQWALIHIEQQWQENEHTVEGELLHKRAHDAYFTEKRKDVIISRGLPVHSRTMGVSGVCDIVEFCRAEDGIPLFGHRGLYSVYPVEYKKGAPKDTEIDILQLTAQAMCLEEMLSAKIQEGAIFYGETRRRDKIVFNDSLRDTVRKDFEEMHGLFERRYTPKVKWSKSCGACSLKDICMPRLGKAPSVRDYISKTLSEDA
jgi:CRISPR-associated exonuclease Cas4